MSKAENRRYLFDAMALSVERRRLRRWNISLLVSWPFLIALFASLYGIKAETTGEFSPEPATDAAHQMTTGLGLSPLIWIGLWAVLVGGAFGLGYFLRKRKLRQIISGLQSPVPSTLVSLLDKLLRLARAVPDWDAHAARSKALIFILYGEEDAARQELSAVRWEHKAPLIRAAEAEVEALRCFLCAHRYSEGLLWARKAQAMSEIGKWPGAAKLAAYYRMIVALGEVLTGAATNATVEFLQQKYGDMKHPGLQQKPWARSAWLTATGSADRPRFSWQ